MSVRNLILVEAIKIGHDAIKVQCEAQLARQNWLVKKRWYKESCYSA
jgi:hypothetical protein